MLGWGLRMDAHSNLTNKYTFTKRLFELDLMRRGQTWNIVQWLMNRGKASEREESDGLVW